MKYPKLFFIIAFAIVAVVFTLFEYDIIPQALIGDQPMTNYIVNLSAIILSVGGSFLLLYAVKNSFVRKHMNQPDETAAYDYANKFFTLRIVAWFLLILTNIVLFYEAPYAVNPKYAVLILFVAGIFCWPSYYDKK